MKTKNINNFKFIAIAVFLFSGAVITLALPTVTNLKEKATDNLMRQADEAEKNQKFREHRALLEQANLIGLGDPRPLDKLAHYFLSLNRADLALITYSRLGNKDYARMGNLALDAQSYNLAEKYFKKAIAQNPQGENLSGLAVAQYNLGNIDQGCANSKKAIQLNLKDNRASNAQKICEILQTPNNLNRENAYFLIQNKVIKVGETVLKNLPDKTLTDYYVLAQISATRGDYKEAIEYAKNGLKVDSTNLALNQALLRYLEATEDKGLERQQKVIDNLILNDI